MDGASRLLGVQASRPAATRAIHQN